MGSGGRFAKLGVATAIGTGLAIVMSLAVYLLARMSGDALTVASQPGGADYQQLPFGAVVIVTVVAGGVAGGIAWLAKRTPAPMTVFLSIGTVGFVLMLYPPLSSAEQASTAAWLVAMHVCVAVPIMGALARNIQVSGPVE